MHDLGVFISSDLSWNAHYKHITAKAYRSLRLIRRTFGHSPSVAARKKLYIALIRSQISYCSPLWRPHLLKDIELLEQIQRRATKFILNDYSLDYKFRLTSLKLLPLMMYYELLDLSFFIRSLKQPSGDSFNIFSHVQFCDSKSTRSSTFIKLKHVTSPNNTHRHFYFNHLIRLWNALPPINIDQSYDTIHTRLREILWDKFTNNSDPSDHCSYHFNCPCYKHDSFPSLFTSIPG